LEPRGLAGRSAFEQIEKPWLTRNPVKKEREADATPVK